MGFFEKIWKFMNSEKAPALKAKAKLSEAEVSEIAKLCGESEGWNSENMQPPHLVIEKGKLVWRIRFASVDENNLPVRGGHLLLIVDDESGSIIEKIIGTR